MDPPCFTQPSLGYKTLKIIYILFDIDTVFQQKRVLFMNKYYSLDLYGDFARGYYSPLLHLKLSQLSIFECGTGV